MKQTLLISNQPLHCFLEDVCGCYLRLNLNLAVTITVLNIMIYKCGVIKEGDFLLPHSGAPLPFSFSVF